RHTRLQGDWSSDVCSSDLKRQGGLHRLLETALTGKRIGVIDIQTYLEVYLLHQAVGQSLQEEYHPVVLCEPPLPHQGCRDLLKLVDIPFYRLCRVPEGRPRRQIP